ncbi:MAG: hypothetical protein B7733_03820 [Myxococcales bacterium FL481]|nr:MAG: hypothetical protein B7733_03820 [Myxococcales bacterium FL481]
MSVTSDESRAPKLVRLYSPFALAGTFVFAQAEAGVPLGAGGSGGWGRGPAAMVQFVSQAEATGRAGSEAAEAGAPADAEKEEGPAAESESSASADAEAKPERRSFKLHSAQLPSMGKAQPWVSNTLWADYFANNYNPQQNDDGFYALVNYLNLGVDTRLRNKGFQLFSLSARIDTQYLPQGTNVLCDGDMNGKVSPNEAQTCTFGNDARIERFTMRLEHRKFKLFVGDFNVNFGRGLALSVRKKNDIGIDSTVKGVKLDLRPVRNVQLSGLWGVANRQQSDFATRRLFQDPGYKHGLCEDIDIPASNKYGARLWTGCSDFIGGARAEAKLPGKVRLGAHYGNIWFGDLNEISDQHEALHFVGGDITRARLFKRWDFFWGTTAIMRNYHHKEHHPSLVETGFGSYISNNFSFGNTNLLIEGKYYDNYVLARDMNPLTVLYTEATTLERQDQQIPAAANSAGPLVRVAHTFPKKGLTFYWNTLGYAYAYANEHDMWYGQDALRLLHTYAGFDWDTADGKTSAKANGGWRWEGYYEPHENRERFERKLPQVQLYLNQALGHWFGFNHSVNFAVDWRRERVWKGDRVKRFHRGNVILGYGLAPFVTAAFIGGFSTEDPAGDDYIKLHPQDGDDEAAANKKPHMWPGGEVRFNFLTSSFVRVFVGRQVGGLLCVNGSCRVLPDFSGARLDLVLAF